LSTGGVSDCITFVSAPSEIRMTCDYTGVTMDTFTYYYYDTTYDSVSPTTTCTGPYFKPCPVVTTTGATTTGATGGKKGDGELGDGTGKKQDRRAMESKRDRRGKEEKKKRQRRQMAMEKMESRRRQMAMNKMESRRRQMAMEKMPWQK